MDAQVRDAIEESALFLPVRLCHVPGVKQLQR
jgi:hypothetical protein